MKQRNKQEFNGNLTVETALVMPVILYTIMLLFYFLLFMYNKSIMTDAALLAVRQTSYYEKLSNSQIEKSVKEKCNESLTDRLVGMENISVTVSVGKFQSNVTIKGDLTMANIGILGKDPPFRTIEVHERAERFRPVSVIRLIKKGTRLKEWITKRREENDESDIQEGFEPQLPDSSENMQFVPGTNAL